MPSRCSLHIPAFVQTLDPSGRRAHWLSQAERHGLDLQLERAVGPAELPAHVPASVLQQLEGLNNATLKKARKVLGIWASNRRFLAAVAARNATPALYIEDDAELKPSFCEHTAAALRALSAKAIFSAGVESRKVSTTFRVISAFSPCRRWGTGGASPPPKRPQVGLSQ